MFLVYLSLPSLLLDVIAPSAEVLDVLSSHGLMVPSICLIQPSILRIPRCSVSVSRILGLLYIRLSVPKYSHRDKGFHFRHAYHPYVDLNQQE